jgi:hypothetical protein
MSGGRSFNQSNFYQELVKNEWGNKDINTSYILPEKKQQLGAMMVKFFKNHEHVL